MKNRFRVVAAAALLVAALAGACASDNKSAGSTMNDNGMEKSGMAMEHKTCAKCGMACDANGMCPHCDAGKTAGSTMMK